MSVDLTRAFGRGLVPEEAARVSAPAKRRAGERESRFVHRTLWSALALLLFALAAPFAVRAQQALGSINGTVTDTSGAVVPAATVKAVNTGTNLTITATTAKNGSYNILNLPLGTYTVTVSKQGFKKVVHSEVLVEANRASTVNTTLQPGAITAEVTVSATPLLDQTDITNGYVLSSKVIQSTPLGTGSFTQLATLAPGVNADLLSGSGSNAGLGNQEIWANGQRDTSNSLSFNGISGNNVFNGKTSSSVGESRFVLNTNEQFLPGGQIQTNTSVYDAIGQGLPTPPPETLEEMHVETSMYDASQGANSGAHIEVVTKSGTNNFHGQVYEYHQTTGWNANQYFLNAQNIDRLPLHRNTFGATLGGPILHNKMFFFGSYQGQRVTDAFNGATNGVNVPPGLTNNNRSAAALAALANTDYGTSLTAADIDPVALKIMQAKTASGQYVVPSQTITDPTTIGDLGYNALVEGPPSTFNADQFNANIDYDFSPRDRFSEKYYYQRNPSTSPFAVSQVLGFSQSLHAGSQVLSLDNITTLTPNTSWEQRIGFVREVAYAGSSQSLTPSGVGINIFKSNYFPGFTISDPTQTLNFDGTGHDLNIGPANNFANAGVFQNQFQAETSYNWIKGIHDLSFGVNLNYGQLNVLNKENQVATFQFQDYPYPTYVNHSFTDFLTGTLNRNSNGLLLNGETNRYYRYKQAGLFVNDGVHLRSNLNVTVGLRWDWDGPLTEKNGMLTNFYPQNYKFNLATDTIQNYGLVVAGNNKQFCATKHPYCVNNSTLTGRQWMFEPRIGVAWSPSFIRNFVVRAGFGLYADRGEFFTKFSPSAGLGISGPFGVTTEEPFTVPFFTTCTGPMCLSNNPFGATAPPAPPSNFSGVQAEIPNLAGLTSCPEPVTPTCTPSDPYGEQFPLLFGGYAPGNTIPYSENWKLDLQWQPYNTLLLDIGYVGNHGVHQVLPIPFNQPGIATPAHPINGQIYSFGYQALDSNGNPLATEQVQTNIGGYGPYDGNTALRVPYIGYNPNSDFNMAEGVSHYNALQIGVTKRVSHGLMFNAAYTWSHALDEGSGLQLFYNGNNPLDPRTAYGNAGFDRTHVFTISYHYDFPSIPGIRGFASKVVNGWGISGVTVEETGQPFSVYDFSGSVGGIFYSADDFITNPILPLAQGTTVQQAQLQGTTSASPGSSYFNPKVFSVPVLQPGQSGVPPCGPSVTGTPNVCDYYETGFGTTGRNIFRGPFQSRFDFDVFKSIKLTERFGLRYDAQFFNLFNTPSFDAPNNDVSINHCYNPQPCYVNPPSKSQGIGLIRYTLGSPRFIQMSLHLTF